MATIDTEYTPIEERLVTMETLKAELAAARAEVERLRADLDYALDVVIWMTGAYDFSARGTAHAGFIKAYPRICEIIGSRRTGKEE